MELSAEIGWAHVTLAELAEKLGLSMAELYDHVDDKTDVLVLLGRLIDRKVLDNVDVPAAGDLSATTARDRDGAIVGDVDSDDGASASKSAMI